MSVNNKLVLLGFLLTFSLSLYAATNGDSFLFPERTDSWWVSNGNVHNGQTLYIQKFKSELAIDDVIDFYKLRWNNDSEIPGYMETDVNGWRIISRIRENNQWVVQVRKNQYRAGSEGILSLMPLTTSGVGHAQTNDNFIPVMKGGELLSTTYSDFPAKARTQTQIFSGRPETVARRLKRYVENRGWTLQDEYKHENSRTQRFEQVKRQLDIAFVGFSGTKTLVFISEVAHGKK